MKRLTILVCTLLLMLACFGCSKNTGSDEPMNEVAANKWGITLEAEQVTASGLTLVCHQSGGEAVADLMTGAYIQFKGWKAPGIQRSIFYLRSMRLHGLRRRGASRREILPNGMSTGHGSMGNCLPVNIALESAS